MKKKLKCCHFFTRFQGVYWTWKPGKKWKSQGMRFRPGKVGEFDHFSGSGKMEKKSVKMGKNLGFQEFSTWKNLEWYVKNLMCTF